MPWTVIEKCLRKEIRLFDGKRVCFPAKPLWAQTLVGCRVLWLWAVAIAVAWSPKAGKTLLRSITDSVNANIEGTTSELRRGLLLTA